MRGFLEALRFLTILPVLRSEPPDPAWLARAAGWFPAAGLFLGAIAAGLFTALRVEAGAGAGPAAFLALAAWVGLTGALHLDGLADAADALGSARSPEDRRRILDDPSTGAFGAAALILALLGKWVFLSSLSTAEQGVEALLLAPVFGRWTMVLAGTLCRYPEGREGFGRHFVGRVGGGALLRATAFALAAAALIPPALAPLDAAGGSFASGAGRGLIVFPAAALAGWAFLRGAARRLGGVNGDVVGASGEITELAALAALVLLPPSP